MCKVCSAAFTRESGLRQSSGGDERQAAAVAIYGPVSLELVSEARMLPRAVGPRCGEAAAIGAERVDASVQLGLDRGQRCQLVFWLPNCAVPNALISTNS